MLNRPTFLFALAMQQMADLYHRYLYPCTSYLTQRHVRKTSRTGEKGLSGLGVDGEDRDLISVIGAYPQRRIGFDFDDVISCADWSGSDIGGCCIASYSFFWYCMAGFSSLCLRQGDCSGAVVVASSLMLQVVVTPRLRRVLHGCDQTCDHD